MPYIEVQKRIKLRKMSRLGWSLITVKLIMGDIMIEVILCEFCRPFLKLICSKLNGT